MDQSLQIAVCHKNRHLCDCLSAVLEEELAGRCFVIDRNEDAVISIQEMAIDVLLVDSELEFVVLNGLAETARRSNRECRILLFASTRMNRSLLDLASIGAEGCIDEAASVQELREAIRMVRQGGSYCSPQVANEIFREMGRKDDSQHRWARYVDDVRLTPREREVLELIAWEKLGNKQIARRLSISLYTVKNHVHNLIEKLGVEDRYAAADLATKRRILVSH